MSQVSCHSPESIWEQYDEPPYPCPHSNRAAVEARLSRLAEQAVCDHVQPFGQPMVHGEDD